MAKLTINVTARDLKTTDPISTAIARTTKLPNAFVEVDGDEVFFGMPTAETLEQDALSFYVNLPVLAAEMDDFFLTRRNMPKAARDLITVKPFSFTLTLFKSMERDLAALRKEAK